MVSIRTSDPVVHEPPRHNQEACEGKGVLEDQLSAQGPVEEPRIRRMTEPSVSPGLISVVNIAEEVFRTYLYIPSVTSTCPSCLRNAMTWEKFEAA